MDATGFYSNLHFPPLSSTRSVTASRIRARATSSSASRPASASRLVAFVHGTPSAGRCVSHPERVSGTHLIGEALDEGSSAVGGDLELFGHDHAAVGNAASYSRWLLPVFVDEAKPLIVANCATASAPTAERSERPAAAAGTRSGL